MATSLIKNVKLAIISTAFLFSAGFSMNAAATALASIYNGNQYQLHGQFLVQDSDRPSDFYILPQSYHLKRRSVYDDKIGDYRTEYGITHQISTIGGRKYSVYNLTLVLDEPSDLERLQAAMLLRRSAGMQAVIKGTAPICGIRLGLPGFESVSGSSNSAVDPNATLIQYSIDSTDAGKCNSYLATTQFNIRIRVPFEQEPAVAEELTSKVGMTLPPVELILPYKYKDHVTMTVNAHDALQELKASAGISGTFKFVSAQLKGSVEQMLNKLQIMGSLHVDCQNPDHSVCDRFVQQAQEILTKIFFTYLPMGTQGDTNPIVVADKEKAAPAKVKVALAIDSQTADRIGDFKLDFSNSVYDSVQAQAQIHVANVPERILDPSVQTLLKNPND